MNKDIPTGLSFDDVLLVPRRSPILPSDVCLHSRVTGKIPLNIPLVSSAMDTVSEDRLAIALAREGGIGVIHRNCTIERQVNMVSRVKRSENIVIDNPQTVHPSMTIAQLRVVSDRSGVSGFPVVDDEGVLRGIVTQRDIWVIEDSQKHLEEVMTPREKLVTSHVGVSQDEAMKILYEHRIEKLPLVDDEDKLVGLMTSADIEKRRMYADACTDGNGHLRVGAAIGVGSDARERAEALMEAEADALFIDAATGHTERVIRLLETLKSDLPDIPVVAGNVVTPDGACDLIDAGAAAVKVGVGPGSICTTRVVSGVGMPQFSAVHHVAAACRERGIPCIADGGIRFSGDIIKALAAGASAVMIGSLLAGTEESPGNTARWQGKTYKEYRGMGSTNAMKQGSSDRYGQNSSGKMVPEGVEGRVPYKGPLGPMVFQLMGGVRSGMGYVGARTLDELQEKAEFVRVTPGGLKESHPHDVTITEEPINYSSM